MLVSGRVSACLVNHLSWKVPLVSCWSDIHTAGNENAKLTDNELSSCKLFDTLQGHLQGANDFTKQQIAGGTSPA